MTINCFIGEYRWLSNFWLAPIVCNEMVFPSNENAYQAMKSIDPKVQRRFTMMTPGQAKRAGKKLDIRPDWDDIKNLVMYELTMQKYRSHADLREKLFATGDTEIIEGNTWGDTYWGQCPIGTGQNNLGVIIMQVRDILKCEEF